MTVINTTNIANAGPFALAAINLFSRGESFDTLGFSELFIEKPLYQFGNFPIAYNRSDIKVSADDFFTKIQAVYHDLKTVREDGDILIVEMDVHYWRNDGTYITLPCTDIFRMEGKLFSELRIFMDVNPVFNPALVSGKEGSVFELPANNKIQPNELMKSFYTKHEDGKQRISAGFLPKWHVNEPHWALS